MEVCQIDCQPSRSRKQPQRRQRQFRRQKQQQQNKLNLAKNLISRYSPFVLIVVLIILFQVGCFAADSQQQQPISSRAAFLRAQRASRQQSTGHSTSSVANSSGILDSITPSPTARAASSPIATSTATSKPKGVAVTPAAVAAGTATGTTNDKLSQAANQLAHNRSARTTDVFQNGDNIIVTNTCEREHMQVNIRTSKPFHGIIHTRNQRQKSICSVEGTGEREYNLDIDHVLNQQDPQYCGVIKARRDSPEDKDLLSVVIAVRFHKNIELSDDKFFLLNCTNRCRRPDCSSSNSSARSRESPNSRLVANEGSEAPDGERESITPTSGVPNSANPDDNKTKEDECSIYKFPMIITLLWCMGILLLAMIISHCIMCSSLVCRCVKTEVEEREPSVYEDDIDDEDNLYNKKNNPLRIDYDNRDIYKTSNNYQPYSLKDDDDENDRNRTKSKRQTSKHRR